MFILGAIILNPSTIVKPCDEKPFQQGNIFCLYDANKIETFSPTMLTPSYWQEQNAVIGTAQGRGTTYFVQHHKDQWVLKHYYRGGLIGKLIHDSYFFTGHQNTRAAREFSLLKKLQALSLPAPRPVAIQVKKHGLLYQADILTERIAQAKDLVAILKCEAISHLQWQKIGSCLRQFHHHGIYHHDLNAHNILIDNNDKIWLIDFDRGEQRTPERKWQQANMNRLLRSFNKEKQLNSSFNWQNEFWKALLTGYLA
ncbi:3-deoxy-D-manno-octulosonic acid kinase [Thalassotalea sp. PP2-459]|uniref:3-deoxy-D-manno-octulosonic acid kinase n=1 Tax=Thalassotalea sp. PP2-459 TaxID=1742724 RepID=UPI0009F92248|nr:3-deoxy-D-manno-octulosonic acid kinase [Thalassotalea sp. PP2-459]